MNSVRQQRLAYHCAKGTIYQLDIFSKKKCCNHRCLYSVYFYSLLLIIYLNAIETLTCCTEMSLLGPNTFGFAQNTLHDFQNTVLNSWWYSLRQMPHK